MSDLPRCCAYAGNSNMNARRQYNGSPARAPSRKIDARIAFGSGTLEINHTDAARGDQITSCCAAMSVVRDAPRLRVGAIRDPRGIRERGFRAREPIARSEGACALGCEADAPQ